MLFIWGTIIYYRIKIISILTLLILANMVLCHVQTLALWLVVIFTIFQWLYWSGPQSTPSSLIFRILFQHICELWIQSFVSDHNYPFKLHFHVKDCIKYNVILLEVYVVVFLFFCCAFNLNTVVGNFSLAKLLTNPLILSIDTS